MTDATSVIPLLLHDPSYTWQDMGNVLRNVFGVTDANAAITVLRNAKIDAGWVAVALVLRDVYGLQDPMRVVQLLRQAGAGWNDAGKVLHDVFSKDSTDTAKLLAEWPFTIPWIDLATLLKDVYGLTDSTSVARVLVRCGIKWINLARVLDSVFSLTDIAVARILQNNGASRNSVLSVLTDYFHLSSGRITDILRSLFS